MKYKEFNRRYHEDTSGPVNDLANSTIKENRERENASRKEFCEVFGIPYRTLQDWELENTPISAYLKELLDYAIYQGALKK